jgi:hypothetical protein
MVVTQEELPIVAADAHQVIEEAKAAGVYVFGGGIDESVDPVLVSADGVVSKQTYPGIATLWTTGRRLSAACTKLGLRYGPGACASTSRFRGGFCSVEQA